MRSFNPFTAPTCKIHALTFKLYIFPSFNKPLSVLRGLTGVLSHANAKKRKKKMLKNVKFHTLIGRFQSNIMAVKWLIGDSPLRARCHSTFTPATLTLH